LRGKNVGTSCADIPMATISNNIIILFLIASRLSPLTYIPRGVL
jgi:hypothetical protein